MRSRYLFYSGWTIMAVAAFLVVKLSLQETPPTLPATDVPAKSARADRPAAGSRSKKTKEPPLSPAARELLAELTETIEQGGNGRILVEKCEKAGVRASDFLHLASVIKPGRNSELTSLRWNLTLVLGAAAKIDGRAAADWYDRYIPREFIEEHESITWGTLFLTVAIGWLRFEPREAIRWAAEHDHLSTQRGATYNLSQILVYWPESDYAGHIEWIEERTRAGSGVDMKLHEAVRLWVREDPDAALGWMESFAENEISFPWYREQGYAAVTGVLVRNRLGEAVEWLASRPRGDAVFDSSRQIVARRLTDSDPVGAIEVAQTMSDVRFRERELLIVDAARNLYRSDPQVVIDWLPESGLREVSQRAILSPDS